MKNRILFSTIDGKENAASVADRLVRENLAACVSIIPNVSSVYKWKGKVETATEQLMMIKTAEDRVDELIARIADLHPYEVPEIVAFEIERGHQPYLDWIVSETRKG